jgi:hypothetical protein
MHTLQKPSSPTNLRAIFRINIRINSVVPAIDAAMAPNSPTTLRAHLSPCPLSKLRGTKPLRCNIVDTESDTPLHLRATSSQGLLQKRCPQQGKRRRASPSSDPGDPDLGFPPEQHHLQPMSAPKMMPTGVTTPSAAIIRSGSPGSRVSPGAVRVERR